MKQQELFPHQRVASDPSSVIQGFRLEPEFITAEEEKELIARIYAQPWQTDYKRRIQQYGYGYGSSGGSPKWLRDFPTWLISLAERVSAAAFNSPATNCVINEYVPPQGIGPHRDYADFGPVVACVSLASDIVTEFTFPEKGLRVPVHVPARSFWTIRGPARWDWLHGIAPRLSDVISGERRLRTRRISVTFRTIT